MYLYRTISKQTLSERGEEQNNLGRKKVSKVETSYKLEKKVVVVFPIAKSKIIILI